MGAQGGRGRTRRDFLIARHDDRDVGVVCSAIVHVRPAACGGVVAKAGLLGGVEVHRHSPAGKIIVSIEAPDDHHVVATLAALGALPGVLSVSLVYQYTG